MTHIYFVRHALPEHDWKEDRTRPLSEEGASDTHKVTEALKKISLDFAISSPYIRSFETIRECAEEHALPIVTDERLRERVRGIGDNKLELLKKRWENHDFHEEGGESIHMVQSRNIAALTEILKNHDGESILLGTHGTALSSILKFYDPSFDRDDFLRLVNYMPYILRVDFEGLVYIGKEEILIVDKEVTVYNQAYKS